MEQRPKKTLEPPAPSSAFGTQSTQQTTTQTGASAPLTEASATPAALNVSAVTAATSLQQVFTPMGPIQLGPPDTGTASSSAAAAAPDGNPRGYDFSLSDPVQARAARNFCDALYSPDPYIREIAWSNFQTFDGTSELSLIAKKRR